MITQQPPQIAGLLHRADVQGDDFEISSLSKWSPGLATGKSSAPVASLRTEREQLACASLRMERAARLYVAANGERAARLLRRCK